MWLFATAEERGAGWGTFQFASTPWSCGLCHHWPAFAQSLFSCQFLRKSIVLCKENALTQKHLCKADSLELYTTQLALFEEWLSAACLAITRRRHAQAAALAGVLTWAVRIR